MAKIKHTKNELKTQREALQRFERFLPMLQLKKQQLQGEIQHIDTRLAEKTEKEKAVRAELEGWVRLLSEPVDLEAYIGLDRVVTEDGNIAGVVIPLLKEVGLKRSDYSLFDTPPWLDDAVERMAQLIELRVAKEILAVQKDRIAEELRVTSQRVNLFEKVKIPECRENIRVIKIYLGDEQTASVVRGKIAKKRTQAYQYEDEAA